MGYKVNFAPQALEQLEQIVRYIAQDDRPRQNASAPIWSIAHNYLVIFRN